MHKHIEIDIEDKRLFAQIAFLVDTENFLREIAEVRDTFKIDKIFEYDDFISWNEHLYVLAGYKLDEVRKINQKIRKGITDEIWENSTRIERECLSELRISFSEKVAAIRIIHRYPPYFDDVIAQAILFNKIGKIKATQAVMYFTKRFSESKTSHEQDAELAILVTPLSTQKEVIEAFEETKRMRKEYESYHSLTVSLDKDTLSNVARDRVWYWQRIDGNSFNEILDDWNNDPKTHFKEDCPKKENKKKRCELCRVDDGNDIIKAVSRYNKQLKSASPFPM